MKRNEGDKHELRKETEPRYSGKAPFCQHPPGDRPGVCGPDSAGSPAADHARRVAHRAQPRLSDRSVYRDLGNLRHRTGARGHLEPVESLRPGRDPDHDRDRGPGLHVRRLPDLYRLPPPENEPAVPAGHRRIHRGRPAGRHHDPAKAAAVPLLRAGGRRRADSDAAVPGGFSPSPGGLDGRFSRGFGLLQRRVRHSRLHGARGLHDSLSVRPDRHADAVRADRSRRSGLPGLGRRAPGPENPPAQRLYQAGADRDRYPAPGRNRRILSAGMG